MFVNEHFWEGCGEDDYVAHKANTHLTLHTHTHTWPSRNACICKLYRITHHRRRRELIGVRVCDRSAAQFGFDSNVVWMDEPCHCHCRRTSFNQKRKQTCGSAQMIEWSQRWSRKQPFGYCSSSARRSLNLWYRKTFSDEPSQNSARNVACQLQWQPAQMALSILGNLTHIWNHLFGIDTKTIAQNLHQPPNWFPTHKTQNTVKQLLEIGLLLFDEWITADRARYVCVCNVCS